MSYNIQLSKYIIGENDFLRIQADVTGEPIGWLEDMTYAEFLDWNNKCIYELTNEEDAWLVGLCGLMKNGRIMLQDMESCVQFEAYGFYFNLDKKIVIVNPR
jgi:hypothetical protein